MVGQNEKRVRLNQNGGCRLRKWAAAAAAGAALAAACAVSAWADPASDLLSVGRKAFADGQYPLAVSSFQHIENDFPESPAVEEARYLHGVSLFYAGRWAESLSVFSLLGIRHPGSPFVGRAAYWVGAANLKLRKWQNALDSLDSYLADPSAAGPFVQSARLYRAVALEGVGRDAEAEEVYRDLLSQNPAPDLASELTYRLAGTELRTGDYAAARDLYGRILLSAAGSPFVPDAAFFTGECELALGNLAEAERRYRTILSLYPDSPNLETAAYRLAEIAWRQRRGNALRLVEDYLARFPTGSRQGSGRRLRADILVSLSRTAEAVSEYQRAVGLLADGPEKQQACYSMGLAQLSLGRKPDAAESFSAAGRGGSRQVAEKAGFQRAVILADPGHAADAIAAFRSFLDSFPDSSRVEEAARMLAAFQQKQGDGDGARASWDWLARRFPRSTYQAEYLYRRATGWMDAGRWGMALDDFQRVRRDYSGSSWAALSIASIGWIYARQGEYPRALPFFLSAAQATAPADSARAQLSAAVCLFDMGRFDKAVDALRALPAGAEAKAGVSPGTVALYVGRALYRMERLPEAASTLGGAASSLAAVGSPLGADALYWRGWALFRQRKPADAAAAFLGLAEGYPSDPRRQEALFRAGICRSQQADDAGAVTLFAQVIGQPTVTPDSGPIVEQAMYERALALSRMGRDQDAAAAREDLARRFPGSRLAAQAFYSQAEQALADGRYADAVVGFDRVQNQFPTSTLAAPASYWAAEAALRSGDAAGAVKRFWSVLLLPAGVASNLVSAAVEGFGDSLRKTGDLASARAYSRGAGSAPGIGDEASAGVQLAAAGMLLDSAPEEARDMAAQVAAAAPPEPYAGEASLLLARYAERKSDWNRALDVLGFLESSRADDVGARAALEKARTLEAMGRTSDAVDEYLKVAHLFPGLPDRGAEGMANAARLARQRGDTDRAARIERSLRDSCPDSPWLQGLPLE